MTIIQRHYACAGTKGEQSVSDYYRHRCKCFCMFNDQEVEELDSKLNNYKWIIAAQ